MAYDRDVDPNLRVVVPQFYGKCELICFITSADRHFSDEVSLTLIANCELILFFQVSFQVSEETNMVLGDGCAVRKQRHNVIIYYICHSIKLLAS